ncbi:MAG: DUF427 domain-containing protein [Pseudomonadota bacterium]
MSGLVEESVWDYPRPPRLERVAETLRVELGGAIVAETRAGFRVLETSHPPTYYLPPGDVVATLTPAHGQSICEWKGAAQYFDVTAGKRTARRAAWAYPRPTPAFTEIAGYLAFYPAAFDACYVAGEKVLAQEGDFYGGWRTSNLRGPFKGGPGTMGW